MAKPRPDQVSQTQKGDPEAALRAFFKIADEWGLTTDEQIKLLGSPPRSTFFKWKKDGGQLSADTVERLSHVLSIYKCLRIVFTDDDESRQWVRKPNDAPFLDGMSALEFMTTKGYVSDVFQVRRYLDAQRGG